MAQILKHLVFEYTPDSLDRILKFLMAIVRNNNTREADFNDQLFHLSQLMVCLILGPLDLNVCLAQFKKEEEEVKQREEEVKKREEQINSIAKRLENIKEEAPTTIYPPIDVVFECEALMQVMEKDGFDPQIENDFKLNKIKQEILPSTKTVDIKVFFLLKYS